MTYPALGVQVMDMTSPLNIYEQTRSNAINEDMNQRKMGMMEEQHDLNVQKTQQSMALAQANAARSQQQHGINQQRQLVDTMFKYADRADTPHKWKALVGKLSEMYGADSVKGFEDFSQRPKALQTLQQATAQMKNYNFRESLPADKQATFDQMGGSGVTVNMPLQEKSFDKAMGKNNADRATKVHEAADTAEALQSDLKVAAEILKNPNVYTGSGGNFIQGLKKFGSTFLSIPLEGVGEAEALQSIQGKFALEDLSMFKGSTTDTELDFAKNMQFGLGKSQRANDLIVGLKQKEIEYKQGVREIYANNNDGRTQQDRTTIRQQLSVYRKEFAKEPVRMLKDLRKLSTGQKSPTAGLNPRQKSLFNKYGIEAK